MSRQGTLPHRRRILINFVVAFKFCVFLSKKLQDRWNDANDRLWSGVKVGVAPQKAGRWRHGRIKWSNFLGRKIACHWPMWMFTPLRKSMRKKAKNFLWSKLSLSFVNTYIANGMPLAAIYRFNSCAAVVNVIQKRILNPVSPLTALSRADRELSEDMQPRLSWYVYIHYR